MNHRIHGEWEGPCVIWNDQRGLTPIIMVLHASELKAIFVFSHLNLVLRSDQLSIHPSISREPLLYALSVDQIDPLMPNKRNELLPSRTLIQTPT